MYANTVVIPVFGIGTYDNFVLFTCVYFNVQEEESRVIY